MSLRLPVKVKASALGFANQPFHPSEYPELYHQEMVEMERSLESYVSAYEVINGPLGSEE